MLVIILKMNQNKNLPKILFSSLFTNYQLFKKYKKKI